MLGRKRVLGVLACGSLLVLPMVPTLASRDSAAAATERSTTPKFDKPVNIAIDGNDLFVTNNTGKSVTELSASTGRLVRVISGKKYDFDGLWPIVDDGGHLFTGDLGGNSAVTEFAASTGHLVRVFSSSTYHLLGPISFAVDGADLFVLNTTCAASSVSEIDVSSDKLVRVITHGWDCPASMLADKTDLFVTNDDAVTEFSASTGRLVRVISGAKYRLYQVAEMAADGGDIFALNADSVTEFSASTGSLVRVISGPKYKLSGLQAIVADAGDIFVTDGVGVTELSASTGSLVRVISGPKYKFSSPSGLAVHAGHVFVANSSGNSLTELTASTGALVRVIGGTRAS